MAYCPQCGREQKCGCDKCHICGIRLVNGEPVREKPTGPALEPAGRRPSRATTPDRKPSVERREPDEVFHDRMRRVLPMVLVVIGCTLILFSAVEMVRASTQFPGEISAVSAAGEIKRVGYYVGNLMYINSARLLVGLALVTSGLLVNDTGPFTSLLVQRKAVRLMGFVLFAAGVCFLLGPVMIGVPGESPTVVTRGLLPALYFAVPVLVMAGLALITCSITVILWYPPSGGKRKPSPSEVEKD